MNGDGSHAADIIQQGVKQTGFAPKFSTGVAETGTDEDGVANILVDGPDLVVGEEDVTEDDPNQPILCRCWGNSIATGERVNVVTLPDGSTWVCGSTAGQPRLIGASSIPGGTANVPVVSTAPERLVALDTEAQVLHPGHAIGIDVNLAILSGGTPNTIIGRVRREDEDGNNEEIGRFLRSNQMGNGESIQSGPRVIDWDPEPELYVYFITVEASTTGYTISLNPSSTPKHGSVGNGHRPRAAAPVSHPRVTRSS